MDGPIQEIVIAGCPITLIGTIPGFVPEIQRVKEAIQRLRPAVVALGIPPEDLADLERLAHEPEAQSELPSMDPHDQHLMELLSRFGETRIPSPDLETAYQEAQAVEARVIAIDMDDATHSEAFTRHVKLRHIVRSNSTRKKLLRMQFEDADNPYTLIQAWDATINRQAPIRAVEEEREIHMAHRLREVAREANGPVLAVVAAARHPGILQQLQTTATSDSIPS